LGKVFSRSLRNEWRSVFYETDVEQRPHSKRSDDTGISGASKMPPGMKGYFVWASDDWGDYVHGATVAQAKAMMWNAWSIEVGEWINMRAHRVRAFDDKPITEAAILEHINGRCDEYGWLIDQWDPICDCDICKEAINA